jgi:hypothetical protein
MSFAFRCEENRILKAQLGGRRLRLNDYQRRRVGRVNSIA